MEPERKKIIKKKPTVDKPPVETRPPAENKPAKTFGKKYTEADVQGLLTEGYMSIIPELWDKIPTGAHIRYTKKDTGEKLPRCERFRPGGFVRCHWKHENGGKMLTLETIPGGSYYNKGGNYISFPVAYDDIDELWKKYDHTSYIEIHLIKNSLSLKNQDINKLKEQVADLENRLSNLEDILRNAIRK